MYVINIDMTLHDNGLLFLKYNVVKFFVCVNMFVSYTLQEKLTN